MLILFFFKQKTAYELRISDWSSDVCSSDLRPVMAELLLQARMAVIPIGARLHDRKLVGEGRARLDAGEGNPGHAVHLERHEQPVPVDRGRAACRERVGQYV